MADPLLDPVTLRLSPPHLESAFWRAPVTWRALRAADRIGLCGSLLANALLVTTYLLRGGATATASAWRGPALGAAAAGIQLAMLRSAWYTRHRTTVQVLQRLVRFVVPLAMWRRPSQGAQMQLMAARHTLAAPFAPASTLLAVLLAEPGVAALGVVNFSVPFHIHVALFLARALLDLFGMAKVTGCSLARLQLEPTLSAACLAADRVAFVLFGLGDADVVNRSESTCNLHAHRFLPSVLLLFVGGLLGLIYNWWVAARGLLGGPGRGGPARPCSHRARGGLPPLLPAAGALPALASAQPGRPLSPRCTAPQVVRVQSQAAVPALAGAAAEAAGGRAVLQGAAGAAALHGHGRRLHRSGGGCQVRRSRLRPHHVLRRLEQIQCLRAEAAADF